MAEEEEEEMEVSEEEEEMEVSEEEEEELEVSEEEEEVEYEEVSEEVSEEEEEPEEEEPEEEDQNPNSKHKPTVLESISNLHSLHDALSEFLSHYNALQQTLNFISSSIDAKSNNKPIKIEDNPIQSEDKQYTELECICRNNGAKTLRKYVSTHLSEINRLSKEVPEALKLSSDPAKLVLEAMGRFYLQGSRAYKRGNKQAIDTRRAGILLLEFYVLARCPVAEHPNALASVKDSARDAAISWRSRLISEGGLEAASAVDALGLVLLLASFGVPSEFRAKDLFSLLRLSNLKKKGDVLCRSSILVQKMPDIIKDLITKDMHVEAVDLICAFELEEKFPPLPLLSSYVKKTCEAGIEERRQGQCSREAYEKELAALKSVLKCVEDNKLDATQLASLKIDQKIAKCEKEILEGEQKLQDKNLKRRFGDVEPLRNEDNQIKQLRPSPAKASHGSLPQSIRQSQEKGIAAVSDSRYAYNGYTLNARSFSSEASHGLVARDSMGLLPQSVHAQGGGLYGNAVYQSSGEHSLLGTAYPSGHDFTRYSAAAAAGQSFYQPPASEQNYYQPPASGQHYYPPPALEQNSYQPPVSGQNSYPLHASSLETGGRILYQIADNVSERELPNYSTTSNGVPTASTNTQPAHQSLYTG